MSKSMSKSINLLPAELRQSARTEVRGSLKRIIVMIVALGTVLFYAGFSVWTFYLGKALEDTRTQMDEIRPRLVQVNKIKEENQNLKAEIAELEKVSQDRMSWASVLQDINRHLPQEMWITHMATEKEERIRVKGIAMNMAEVGVFLYQLNHLPYFSEFLLEKATEIKMGDISCTEFSLLGTLSKGGD